MRGSFITLEGIDGCGKSTQHLLLVEALKTRGIDPLATREPGGTRLGEAIRSQLSAYSTALTPATELLLIVAARAQHDADFGGIHLAGDDCRRDVTEAAGPNDHRAHCRRRRPGGRHPSA